MPAMAATERAFCNSGPWRSVARHWILPWALQNVPLTGTVVELGAGSGAMAVELLERYPEIEYRGLEIDPKLAADAHRRVADRHARRAEVTVGDAADSNVAPESADVVCSFLMLHHTLDAAAVIDQTVRRLRPGGWFVGYDFADCRLARLLHRLDRSPHDLYTLDQIAALLDVSHWTQVQLEPAWKGQAFRFRAQLRS